MLCKCDGQEKSIKLAIRFANYEALMPYGAKTATRVFRLCRKLVGLSLPCHLLQAALSSAGTFTISAVLPLIVAWVVPETQLIAFVAISSLIFLALLGSLAAGATGATISVDAFRFTFWGALAMALSARAGRVFGVAA